MALDPTFEYEFDLLLELTAATLFRMALDPTYWLEHGGEVKGPYTFELLSVMWSRKELRVLDRVCKNGTQNWVEVSRLVHLLEKAEHAESGKPSNPPSFGMVVVATILLPVVGLIAGIVWPLTPRYRSSGGAILGIAFVVMLIWTVVLSRF